MCGGLCQAIIAFTLCYSVIAIRYMIGKQGLAQKVNYSMFLVNAGALLLYAISAMIWYYFFFDYSRIYYNSETGKQQKNEARAMVMKAWMVSNICNFFAQLCLIYILSSFGKKKQQDEKTTAHQTGQKTALPVQDDSEIERLEGFDEGALDTDSNVKDLFSYAESSLNSEKDPLGGDGDEVYNFNEVKAVDMEDNDIEQRIWAQFVRNKSDYKGSQKSQKTEILAVSVNTKSTRTNSINVLTTNKEAMISGFEQDFFDDS